MNNNPSFAECINQFTIPDKYKKNKSKIQPLVQVLKSSVETMQPNTTMKAFECIIDKETYAMKKLEESCKQSRDVLTLDESVGYGGVWNVDGSVVNYKITPRRLVKNLQSKYRDLSVFWFMNDTNKESIDAFITLHRFYTVVYSIEIEEKETKDVEKEIEIEIKKEIEVTKKIDVKPSLSYASILKSCSVPTKKEIVDDDNSCKTTVCDSHSDSGTLSMTSQDTIPVSYRGGKYNKTEFENVREYYQKWGNDRMFVMFGTRGETFDPTDKKSIRNLLNNVLRDPKYQELIRDNEYYYIKVVKNFHYDSSRLLSSLHFNVVFKNELNASGVYHIYVDPSRFKVIRVSALFNDVRY